MYSMIQSLADIWVFSDMNGALLNDSMQITKADLESIRLFTMMGGKFSIITERTLESIEKYPDLIPYLSLSAVNGGCSLYDFTTNFRYENGSLPIVKAKRALSDIFYHFSKLGILIIGGDGKNYQISGNKELDDFLKIEQLTYLISPSENLPDNWNKIIFTGNKEILDQLEYYLSKRTYLGISFMTMSPTRLEMYPEKVTKGFALERICAVSSFPLENTIAIGNYYNDIDMMKLAGFSVAVENSPKEVRMIANDTISSSNQSGVGQFLYSLLRKYE